LIVACENYDVVRSKSVSKSRKVANSFKIQDSVEVDHSANIKNSNWVARSFRFQILRKSQTQSEDLQTSKRVSHSSEFFFFIQLLNFDWIDDVFDSQDVKGSINLRGSDSVENLK